MKSAILIRNFSERQIDFASGEFYENSAFLQKKCPKSKGFGQGFRVQLFFRRILNLLQPEQANARFSKMFSPFLEIGMMCSTSKVEFEYFSCDWLYSQRPSARLETSSR